MKILIIGLVLFVAKIQGIRYDSYLENFPADQVMVYQTHSAGPACNNEQFGQCVDKFTTDIGMPSFPESSRALALYLNKLIATERAAGFEQVCKAVHDMQTCLGDQIDSCFAPEHLAGLGILPQDIMGYRVLRAMLTSECGRMSYYVILKRIDCVVEVETLHWSEYVSCIGNFNANCDSAQKVSNCTNAVYSRYCGIIVGYYMCEAANAALTVVFPSCTNLTCTPQPEKDGSLLSTGFFAGHPANFLVNTIREARAISMLGHHVQQTQAQEDDDSDNISANSANL